MLSIEMKSIRAFCLPLIVGAAGLISLLPPSLGNAFPGAEGFGAGSVGGRGGVVIHVINLNDSGPGSLREAVNASGPRTVVFHVGGTIQLQSPLVIQNSKITIAGQTAPGGGICLRDYPLIVRADDVIIRFLRCRLGDESAQESDGVWVQRGRRIIFDHCSVSWSVDETFSVSTDQDRIDEVTVQWCFITESLNNSIHTKESHGYGSLLRGNRGSRYSFHHNLYAHHRGRSPRPGVYDNWDHERDPDGLLLDFRNNVIYDFGGGHAGYNGDHESITKINYVGNFLKRGVNSRSDSVAYKEQSIYNKGHFANNMMDGVIPVDPYQLVRYPPEYTPTIIAGYKQAQPFAFRDVLTDHPALAYDRVLAEAGASFPLRDLVDARVVNQVRSRTGTFIDTQTQVGGWPQLASGPAPVDSDMDGMPDNWELARGLDPHEPDDRNNIANSDGHTQLEAYLNWLVRPTVSVTVEQARVFEGETAEVVIERTGYTTDPLLVPFEISGAVTEGEDYESPGIRAIIRRGDLRTTVNIQTLTDPAPHQPNKHLRLRLTENPDQFLLGDLSVTNLAIENLTPAASLIRLY